MADALALVQAVCGEHMQMEVAVKMAAGESNLGKPRRDGKPCDGCQRMLSTAWYRGRYCSRSSCKRAAGVGGAYQPKVAARAALGEITNSTPTAPDHSATNGAVAGKARVCHLP